MKKISILTAVLMCLAMLGGCGDSSKMDSLLDSKTSSESSAEKKSADSDDSAAETAVDLDLTLMDGTMVYSTVYDMVTNPGTYLGKTVRIKGTFSSSYDETSKMNYYFVVVGDVTSCCSQGVEFIWDNNEHSYPDDYPAENAQVEISGTFDQYDELGNTYFYVAADNLTVL